MIGVGIAAIAVGFLLQALVVRAVSSEAPPQFGMNSGFGDAAAVSMVTGLAILGGLVLAIIGVVRYAQSGATTPVVFSSPAAPTAEAEPSRGGAAQSAAPAFCSSCGAGLVGEGRYCASCGAPTVRAYSLRPRLGRQAAPDRRLLRQPGPPQRLPQRRVLLRVGEPGRPDRP